MLYLNIGLTVLALIEHQYLINSLASIYNEGKKTRIDGEGWPRELSEIKTKRVQFPKQMKGEKIRS